MIANRIVVHLLPDEQAALSRMVEADVRPPAIQLRYLLTEEARKRGLLPTNATNPVAEVFQAEATGFVEANL